MDILSYRRYWCCQTDEWGAVLLIEGMQAGYAVPIDGAHKE